MRLAFERAHDAQPVGVRTDQAFAVARHRVDRADASGGRVDRVEVRDHRLLVRDRHGELAHAERARAGQRRHERRRRHVERDVDGVDAERSERRVVHRRRARVAGRMEDDAAELRSRTDRRGHGFPCIPLEDWRSMPPRPETGRGLRQQEDPHGHSQRWQDSEDRRGAASKCAPRRAAARRDPDGQRVRLGHDEARRGSARRTGRRERRARDLGAPDASPPPGLRDEGRGERHRRDHRGRRRRRAPRRRHGRSHAAARARCADRLLAAAGTRRTARDGADAGRDPRWHARDRQGRRKERGAARRGDPRAQGSRGARRARAFPSARPRQIRARFPEREPA